MSRILSGERTPNMGHLVDMARALDWMPQELVVGTEHQDVLDEWVSAEEYSESELERFQLKRERDALDARLLAICGERDALQAQAAGLRNDVAKLSQRVADARIAMDTARTAEQQALSELEVTRRARDVLLGQRNDAIRRATRVQEDLLQSRKETVGVGVVGTLVGSFLGALASESRR